MKSRKSLSWCAVVGLTLAAPFLLGCQVQWVSPYNADLQKKASDMLSDVVAWEAHMRTVAGTAAADPRNPDVQSKLDSWRGDIEAMSQIEIGIDPGSTSCDAFLKVVNDGVASVLKANLPTTTAASSGGGGLGLTAPQPITHCETLPNVFSRMMKQVGGNYGDNATEQDQSKGLIQVELEQQCQLPWLSDAYFANLQERRSTEGATTPARPTAASAAAGTPTTKQQQDATANCRALFDRAKDPVTGKLAAHGNLVASLVVDLDAIIYREGREAPQSSK